MKKVCFGMGAVIIICMAAMGIYGLYNLMTDSNFGTGTCGTLIFLIAEPVCFLLLALDVLIWYRYQKKHMGNQSK